MSQELIRIATFLAPNMFPVYRFIADYVTQKLDIPTSLTVGQSFDQFAARQIDVGFICGLPYVQLADQPSPPVELLAAPVLSEPRYGDKPVYFSDVIVLHSSPYQSFADLQGCTWAYNDPDSHSGNGVVRYKLAQIGAYDGYFTGIIESGAHQKSIRLVQAGAVDASAIDSQVLAIELRDHPELRDQFRVIDVLGPSPIQPVVAAAHVPNSLKADLRAVLLAMGDDPAARDRLAHGFVHRFASVSDSDYDPIREMLALGEKVNFRPR